MKCASDPNAIYEGKPNPDGTKNGGAVCPSRRQRFAEWLIDGLQLYALSGMPVYALSFQNERLFRQSYNSSRYPQGAYADTLADIGPVIHAALSRREAVLDTEAGKNDVYFDPYWYTGHLLAHPASCASSARLPFTLTRRACCRRPPHELRGAGRTDERNFKAIGAGHRFGDLT